MINKTNPKFLFVHIAKAGGTSITKAIAEHLNVDRSILRNSSNKFIDGANIPLILKDEIDDYFVFSFVRSPWARAISYFHYLQQIRQPPFNIPRNIEFKSWIKQGGFIHAKNGSLTSASSQLSNDDGIYSHIDFIGKIENVDADWQYVSDKLNLSISLGHRKRSEHEHYTSYYDEETIDIISNHYKRDVELFNYNFGD